jgi:5-methylcytosine-specific restriction endonuclease McrA
MLNRCAPPKPRKGTSKRLKAQQKRIDATLLKLAVSLVDVRDGLRCRICGEYAGVDIQHHHIVYRSKGGEDTTANLISLCANCHLVGVHRGHFRLSGNADTRDKYGRLCGVTVERIDGDRKGHTFDV